jgi:hypothetical protein
VRQREAQRNHWFEPLYGLKALVIDPDRDRWHATAHLEGGPDGRLVVRSVELQSHADRLDVEQWRAFPLARVESEANQPDMYQLLWEHRHMKPPTDDPRLEINARAMAAKRRLPMRSLHEWTELPGKKPDAFYKQVAARYRYYVAHGMAPAKEIAEDSDLPVTTVHRWIREARRRKLLEPTSTRGRVS